MSKERFSGACANIGAVMAFIDKHKFAIFKLDIGMHPGNQLAIDDQIILLFSSDMHQWTAFINSNFRILMTQNQ